MALLQHVYFIISIAIRGFLSRYVKFLCSVFATLRVDAFGKNPGSQFPTFIFLEACSVLYNSAPFVINSCATSCLTIPLKYRFLHFPVLFSVLIIQLIHTSCTYVKLSILQSNVVPHLQ